MSVFAGLSITISKFNPKNKRKIKTALERIWPFEDRSYGDELSLYGESSVSYSYLYDIGEEIGEAVFKANGKKKAEILAEVAWLEHVPREEICIPEKYTF